MKPTIAQQRSTDLKHFGESGTAKGTRIYTAGWYDFSKPSSSVWQTIFVVYRSIVGGDSSSHSGVFRSTMHPVDLNTSSNESVYFASLSREMISHFKFSSSKIVSLLRRPIACRMV